MTTPTPQPYQPVVGTAPGVLRRPPLTRRQKRGAVWGGTVGFNLLTLGWSVIVVPIALALFSAVVTVSLGQIGRTSNGEDPSYNQLREFLSALNAGAWVIPIIIACLIGLAIMAVALLVSRGILRAHQVNRPWGVTWAGAGIAIVGLWILGWVPVIIAQTLSTLLNASGVDVWANFAISGGLYLILGIAVNALLGWLAWWWMSHAFRSATTVATVDANAREEVQE